MVKKLGIIYLRDDKHISFYEDVIINSVSAENSGYADKFDFVAYSISASQTNLVKIETAGTIRYINQNQVIFIKTAKNQ